MFVCIGSHLVFVEAASYESLGVVNGVLRTRAQVAQRVIAHHDLPVIAIRDNGREDLVASFILDDDDLALLVDAHD